MWTDLSTISSQFTRVTDGQTDRRTDRILIAKPRLHSMQRGKNKETNLRQMQAIHAIKHTRKTQV